MQPPKVWKTLDLYKADIYSLGVTLYQVASCLNPNKVNQINESEEEMETVKHDIHKLKLPLEIKQTILSMMSFNPDNRIASFSLY
jgi:serine/threonine protein kinase